jgi:hypothetical protein
MDPGIIPRNGDLTESNSTDSRCIPHAQETIMLNGKPVSLKYCCKILFFKKKSLAIFTDLLDLHIVRFVTIVWRILIIIVLGLELALERETIDSFTRLSH